MDWLDWMYWIGLELNWIGLELNWIGLDWIGLDWIGLDGLDELMIKMGNLEIEEDLKEIEEFDKMEIDRFSLQFFTIDEY